MSNHTGAFPACQPLRASPSWLEIDAHSEGTPYRRYSVVVAGGLP